MHSARNIIARTALAGLLAAASVGTAQAVDTSLHPTTLKPISGQGAAPGQHFLLNVVIGKKQAVSYFQNEGGVCRLTLLVAEAFNGEDTPNETTVRFAVDVDPTETALIDTADGKRLEFTCLSGAEAISVKLLDQIAGVAPTM